IGSRFEGNLILAAWPSAQYADNHSHNFIITSLYSSLLSAALSMVGNREAVRFSICKQNIPLAALYKRSVSADIARPMLFIFNNAHNGDFHAIFPYHCFGGVYLSH